MIKPVTEKDLEKALERHEENFEKELKEVDIRAVVLKTKKSVLEQALSNARIENSVMDHDYYIKDLKRKTIHLESEIKRLKEINETQTKVFTKAFGLLQNEIRKTKKQKGFFSKFWEFIKCLIN
jgi:hypothetical protein